MELSLIARVRDGLILTTSIEGNDRHDSNLVKYSNQAKMLFKKLNGAPAEQSVESGPYVFHYIIKDKICALVLCERNFPRKTAFAYLLDIANEFNSQNFNKIETVVRPYHFLEFDKYIQQAKRKYADNGRFSMDAVSNELQDVTRIMFSNIEDVIHRGEALNILENRATELSGMSKKFREDAKALNRRSTIFKVAVAVGLCGLIFFILRFGAATPLEELLELLLRRHLVLHIIKVKVYNELATFDNPFLPSHRKQHNMPRLEKKWLRREPSIRFVKRDGRWPALPDYQIFNF
ncbi:unnamed protein product [Caenorhabditis auriculariae]|uniref:Uncharacterized protein n=1 Tax=Caenorhabditis auriculariae TaxID=2777116 RepID=A0A8S1H1D6_9PELO|nr:unnamed protein product [Caenorhabditis auriculariae]